MSTPSHFPDVTWPARHCPNDEIQQIIFAMEPSSHTLEDICANAGLFPAPAYNVLMGLVNAGKMWVTVDKSPRNARFTSPSQVKGHTGFTDAGHSSKKRGTGASRSHSTPDHESMYSSIKHERPAAPDVTVSGSSTTQTRNKIPVERMKLKTVSGKTIIASDGIGCFEEWYACSTSSSASETEEERDVPYPKVAVKAFGSPAPGFYDHYLHARSMLTVPAKKGKQRRSIPAPTGNYLWTPAKRQMVLHSLWGYLTAGESNASQKRPVPTLRELDILLFVLVAENHIPGVEGVPAFIFHHVAADITLFHAAVPPPPSGYSPADNPLGYPRLPDYVIPSIRLNVDAFFGGVRVYHDPHPIFPYIAMMEAALARADVLNIFSVASPAFELIVRYLQDSHYAPPCIDYPSSSCPVLSKVGACQHHAALGEIPASAPPMRAFMPFIRAVYDGASKTWELPLGDMFSTTRFFS